MSAAGNYKDTLQYLYSRLPMYQRVGVVAFKKDLTNTLALCAHLHNPQSKFPCIHVGGTNGKGSVSHMLAAVCQAAGLKVGLYTSPHYKDFRERIKINGKFIPRPRVVDFVENNKAAIEAIEPSFFELTVALAFDHFAKEKVDIALIEVGLGGRLDSTNVITPLLSVITNISYDHMDMLGDTLDKIAFEKAGIIKTGVPVVIGETHPESAPVFLRKAEEMQAPIVFADQRLGVREASPPSPLSRGEGEQRPAEINAKQNSHLQNKNQQLSGSESTFSSGEGVGGEAFTYDIVRDQKDAGSLQLQGGGPYQVRNLATVLQAWETLGEQPGFLNIFKNKKIPAGATARQHWLKEGLAHLRDLTRFMGRWQVIGREPTVLCDSAHNEAGLRAAFGQIGQMDFGRLHIVCGFVADKDLNKALALFPTNAAYYFAKANIPRGLDAGSLRDTAAGWNLHGKSYTSVRRALAAAKLAAAKDDLIVVIGSIFVVAEVL